MIARPKISRNERKTTEIGAFEVGNFAPFSCPGYCAATGSVDAAVCLPLYGGCAAWTLLYDTLYAHQDKRDDAKLGLGSSALALGDARTPPFLRACGAAAVGGLAAAGGNAGLGDVAAAWPFYASLAVFASHLAWQVETADLGDPDNLAARFKSNAAVAPVVLLGIAAATANLPPGAAA